MVKLISKPNYDDRAVLDVTLSLYAYPAILVGHQLGLFKILGPRSKKLSDICDELSLKRRSSEIVLSVAMALGFVNRELQEYSLTQLGKDYLLDDSPAYFGYFFDLMVENSNNYSIKHLEKAIRDDEPQAYGEKDIFESHRNEPKKAEKFTLAMHSLSIGAATQWPDMIDLSKNRLMLDIGGGSGVHSIGAVSRWPDLCSLIYDLDEICDFTKEHTSDYGFQNRIDFYSGDMWHDPFPVADLHFYSHIFHDWPPENNRFLAEKSFNSLPTGGRIMIHEILYNDQKTGPLAAAAFSVMMLGWTQGEQYSGRELSELLSDAGFVDIEVIPSFGYYSVVTGLKP